jgi:hypothetical protein
MISHTVKLLERTFTKYITIVDVYPSLAFQSKQEPLNHCSK